MQNRLWLFVTFIAFLGIHCSGPQEQQEGYVLEGTIQNAANKKLFLESWAPAWVKQKTRIIDTATIQGDGHFRMEGKLKNKGIYQLRVGTDRAKIIPRVYPPMRRGTETTIQILMDNSTITFNGNAQQIGQYKIKGPAGASTVQNIAHKINKTYSDITQLQKNARQAQQKGGDVDSIKTAMQQQFKQLMENYRQFFEGMLDTCKNPVVRLYAVSHLNPNQDIKQIKTVVDNVKKEYTSPVVRSISQKINKLHKFAKGQPAQDIRLPNPEGDTIALSSLEGKVVLLDFWASWCKPCRIANPKLVKAYKKYKDKGFTIYSVSLDKHKKRWVRAIKQDNLMWDNHVSDLKGWNSRAANKYNISSIPAAYLIDREGNIMAKNLRGQRLHKKLADIFEKGNKKSTKQ